MRALVNNSLLALLATIPLFSALLVAEVLGAIVSSVRMLRIRRWLLTFSLLWLIPFVLLLASRFLVIR